MQALGYVILDGKKVKILVRESKHGRYLKIRASGKDGVHFSDEQSGLESSDYSEQKKALSNGEVIYL